MYILVRSLILRLDLPFCNTIHFAYVVDIETELFKLEKMYLGRGGGCAVTSFITLTPHSTEMTQERFLWNYFTFAGTPFHLQLTAREKKK